ncbi:MAG: glycoside hydrolase family 2, partial [Firmicutes bacterium]|nr:glycoside hydrolase family 2 [Bacillota bacterium]
MRRIMNLNHGWMFHLGDPDYAWYKGYEELEEDADQSWRPVTLPHDWSVEHPFDQSCSSGTGYVCGGVGWYRLRFNLPEDIEDKTLRVTFGGVYKNARVWCNSNYLGMRPSGYATFTHDITPFAIPGENVLAVRAEHIDLADSRWFTGSGIYRDVTLTIADRVHFLPDGVFVSTISAIEAQAELKIEWDLSEEAEVEFDIAGASAKASGKTGNTTIAINRPKLWSPDSPALYTLTCRAGEDQLEIPFGIHTFHFDANTGFYLNGQNLKLKGVCLHHDAGALGAAAPKDVWRRRLRKLKAAGCNAVRTAHNPPEIHLLDLCDEMGFLVMDEAFDEWEGCKNKWWQGHNVYPPKHYGYADAFPEWHERDLAAMVRRDRNHPCVILWSIGNEIDYPNDPYCYPLFRSMQGNNDANKPIQEQLYDPDKPDARRLGVIAQRLAAIVKAHDTTRPVTAALAFPDLSNRIGFAQALDVVGYNYKEKLYARDRETYPAHVIYGSENGHGEEQWSYVRDRPDICGQFLWTGIDYLGEAAGWPVRLSPAGLLTTAGFEKPRWYQRRAMWTG